MRLEPASVRNGEDSAPPLDQQRERAESARELLARTGEDAFHVRSSNVCRLHRCYYVSLSRVCTPSTPSLDPFLRLPSLFRLFRSFPLRSRGFLASSLPVRTWRARKARYDPAIISLDYGIIVDYLWPKVRYVSSWIERELFGLCARSLFRNERRVY